LRGPPKEGRGNLTVPLCANEYPEIAEPAPSAREESPFLKDPSLKKDAMTFRVGAGIHSRRRAMDELGLEDPDTEFGRWLEEEEKMPLAKRETPIDNGQGA